MTGPFAAPSAASVQSMLTLERSSLNRKLMSMCLQTAASALLVAWLAFALTSVLGQRRAETQQLAALAGVVAQSSLDALQFNDRRLAGQMLAALQARETVSAAVLYDRKGRVFASWRAPGRDGQGPDPSYSQPLADIGPEALAEANRAGGRPWLPVMRIYRALGTQDNAQDNAQDAINAPAGVVSAG